MSTKSTFGLALAVIMVLGLVAPAMAQDCPPEGDPPGCTTNFIGIGITVTPSLVHPGDNLTYTVTVINPDVPGFCNVVQADVWFIPPNPDGSPPDVASPTPPPGAILLDTNASFPVGSAVSYPLPPIPATANVGVNQLIAGAVVDGLSETQVVCSPVRAATQIPVTVIAPCIEVTKEVNPTVSKAGEEVIYHICVTNCSANGTELVTMSVVDTILGDITGAFPIPAPGQTVCADFPYTIQPGDPDPLINVVTASGTDVLGLVVTDEATAEVDIVHPCLACEKTADTGLSKVGEVINYTLTVINCSDDVALVNIAVVDSLLGDKSADFADSLAPGASESHTYAYTVQPGDPDPLVNVMTVTANPEGFPQNLEECAASVTVDIVHPCLACEKTADTGLSKVGDVINYTLTVINCSDDVALVNIGVVDSLLGDKSADFADSLAPGASESHTYAYTVQPGDPDPLINVMTVTANPEGFPQNLEECAASVEVDLVNPDFTITKSCAPDPVSPGETLTWTVELCNTGDVSLDIHVTDAVAGIDETVTVAPGDCTTITRTYLVTEADCDSTISNVATATATITGGLLPNVIGPLTADCSVTVPPCEEGATRTPGYWFTHPTKLLDAFECITGSPDGTIVLCATDSCEVDANDAMAIFYRSVGGNRPALAVHILAAMFNECVFGTPAPDGIIANGLAVLCDPNARPNEISAVLMPLDEFNNSGTDIVPDGWEDVPADPATSKAMAQAGVVPDCAKGTQVK